MEDGVNSVPAGRHGGGYVITQTRLQKHQHAYFSLLSVEIILSDPLRCSSGVSPVRLSTKGHKARGPFVFSLIGSIFQALKANVYPSLPLFLTLIPETENTEREAVTAQQQTSDVYEIGFFQGP